MWCWHLDYQAPNFVAALREVVTYHIQHRIWSEAAPEHLSPLGGSSDITEFKQLGRERLNRHSYYLNAIVQGAMEAHSINHFKLEPSTNEIVCNHCRSHVGDANLW